MQTILFQPTWEAWSQQASKALADGLSPSEIFWVPEEHDAQGVLPIYERPSRNTVRTSAPRVASSSDPLPPDFVRFGKLAAHHQSEDRFALLYSLLWRIRQGERDVLEDMLDPEVFRVRRMAAAVRDDLKEARSRLRLRDPSFEARRSATPRTGLPDLVGWCEPRHRVLPLVAEELAARSPDRSFALLSPQATAFWDGRCLDLGPGSDRAGARSLPELSARWEDRHRIAA